MQKVLTTAAGLFSVCAIFLSMYVFSVQRDKSAEDADRSEYVAVIDSCVQNAVNPLFNSVDDVLLFREKQRHGIEVDNVFMEIPEETLKIVAGTLIKRENFCSKRRIVEEYKANRQVYDNLPQQPASVVAGTSGGMPYSQPKDTIPSGVVTFSQKDTTIGGKTFKERTKTEVTYE